MFKYNEWSDLKDSNRLVMPIRKENGRVYCLTDTNEEVYFNFDDFDFDKTPGERSQGVEIIIDDNEEEEEEDRLVIINDVTVENKVAIVGAILKVRPNTIRKREKDHFVEDALEKKLLLDKVGYNYNNLRNVKVYLEQVS
jgi:hypothetical protein